MMQKIGTTRIAAFTLPVLGTLTVAEQGIQTNAFALQSDFDTKEDLNVLLVLSTILQELRASSSTVDNLDVCPYPACQ